MRRCCWFFNRTCAYSLITQNIIEVAAIFRIQHLIVGGESAFGHGANMHVANRLNASKTNRARPRGLAGAACCCSLSVVRGLLV